MELDEYQILDSMTDSEKIKKFQLAKLEYFYRQINIF